VRPAKHRRLHRRQGLEFGRRQLFGAAEVI
jgi:hypothetical protein